MVKSPLIFSVAADGRKVGVSLRQTARMRTPGLRMRREQVVEQDTSGAVVVAGRTVLTGLVGLRMRTLQCGSPR